MFGVMKQKGLSIWNSIVAIAYNEFALGAVADFGARNCQTTTKADARCNVELTT